MIYLEAYMLCAEKKESELKTLDWNYMVNEISNVFRMSEEETKAFSDCGTARIIAELPFAAGCSEPERTAILHLCIYIAEIRGFQRYFAHLPSDDGDIFTRLGCIADFEGGDQDIIEHGMCMLALIMIEGYKRSECFDRANGVYNPFASGSWNYESLRKNLEEKLNKISCPNLDSIFEIGNGFWKYE